MNAPNPSRSRNVSRRDFISFLGAGALTLGLAPRVYSASAMATPSGKKLRGIFPIAQTPFTADDKLDVPALVKQYDFIDRGGVHGYVWPQLASEWATLSEPERMAGMEAVGAAAKKKRAAVIFGVQGADAAAVKRYIKHAEKTGADAIISLPPSDTSNRDTVVKYYQDVGNATTLPVFVQAVGNMDVDLILELYRTVPTIRFVKDEAGDPLQRVGPLREKSHNDIKVFSGNHGRKMIEELEHDFSGSMPAAGFADMYATTFDLWQAGKHDEAKANHTRTLAALDIMLKYGTEGMKYVLVSRGVFTTYGARKPVGQSFGGAAKVATGGNRSIDEAGKKAIQDLLVSLKPHLKA